MPKDHTGIRLGDDHSGTLNRYTKRFCAATTARSTPATRPNRTQLSMWPLISRCTGSGASASGIMRVPHGKTAAWSGGAGLAGSFCACAAAARASASFGRCLPANRSDVSLYRQPHA